MYEIINNSNMIIYIISVKNKHIRLFIRTIAVIRTIFSLFLWKWVSRRIANKNTKKAITYPTISVVNNSSLDNDLFIIMKIKSKE